MALHRSAYKPLAPMIPLVTFAPKKPTTNPTSHPLHAAAPPFPPGCAPSPSRFLERPCVFKPAPPPVTLAITTLAAFAKLAITTLAVATSARHARHRHARHRHARNRSAAAGMARTPALGTSTAAAARGQRAPAHGSALSLRSIGVRLTRARCWLTTRRLRLTKGSCGFTWDSSGAHVQE